MDCGEGNSLFLGKRNCCEGLTCMSPFGWGRCEKGINRKIINIRIVVKKDNKYVSNANNYDL